MSEKINVLVGANVGPLVDNLKVAAKEMTTFGQNAAQKVHDTGVQMEATNQKIQSGFKSLQQNYRATYKDAQILAQQQGVNSQAFQEAARAAAAYKDELEDVQDALKAASPEQRWKLIGGAIGAATDVAQGFVGVMSLIGIETNEAQKYIQAMMSLSAISGAVNGIIQLGDAYKALSAATATATVTTNTFYATALLPLVKAAALVTAAFAMMGGSLATNDTLSKKLDVEQANKSLEKANGKLKVQKQVLQSLTFEASLYKDKLEEMRMALDKFKANQDSKIDLSGAGQIEMKLGVKMPKFEVPDQIKQVKHQFKTINQEIQISMQDIANSLAMGIESVVLAAASGGDIGKALAGSLLNSMGNFMTAWGAQLILVGLGAEALKASLASLNGIAAIAAGVALVAAGAGAKAMAANFNNTGAASSASAYSSGSGQMMPSFAGGGGQFFTLDGTVRGQDLVISTNTTRRDNRR